MRWNDAVRNPMTLCAMLVAASSPALAQTETAVPAKPPAESPLVIQPTTVDGYFDATLLMVKLARPELARYYLEQLLNQNPAESDLLALRDKYGTGTFVELTGVEALQPLADQLVDKLTQAVRNLGNQPGYVQNILPRLNGSTRERAEALTELRHLGPYAVPAILTELQSDRGVSTDVLVVALTRLGQEIAPTMVGALTSPNDTVRAVAADVLGYVGGENDAIWLWAPAFAEDQSPGVRLAARRSLARLLLRDPAKVAQVSGDGAAAKLLQAALAYLGDRHKWSEVELESPELSTWSWDSAAGTIQEHVVPRRNAATFFAERLARESAQLAPSSEDAAIVLLAALLTREVEESGWDKPIPQGPATAFDLLVRTGPVTTEQLLRLSLAENLIAPALASIEALGQTGSVDLLKRPAGGSPIIEALDFPSTRVQFAAAVTILEWEPVKEFRGSRRVVEILARALNSEGHAVGVIMDPNSHRASQTGGIFGEVGFRPQLAATGQAGFQTVAQRGDVELAVLHPNVIRWELTQTIANLRADARTANIPVVIYGPAAARHDFDRLVNEFQRVAFVDEASDSLGLNRGLKPVLAQLNPPPLTHAQRTERIEEAAFWLRRLAMRNVAGVFDLSIAEEALIGAVNQESVAPHALVALGAIGSPRVQEALLNVVIAPSMKPEIRQDAARQLAFHIARYGLLLREGDVSRLRNVWSLETDAGLRTALASVLGATRPTSAAARKQILAWPASAAPVGNATP
ncbi:hypothetical protein [Planctomicrobium sp. SH664]|uniref:hypothetical protein n=1 Tax=Planctomicrobium sp. SH664 TaxID=3448125 RepID=UPI003F5C36A0